MHSMAIAALKKNGEITTNTKGAFSKRSKLAAQIFYIPKHRLNFGGYLNFNFLCFKDHLPLDFTNPFSVVNETIAQCIQLNITAMLWYVICNIGFPCCPCMKSSFALFLVCNIISLLTAISPFVPQRGEKVSEFAFLEKWQKKLSD